jgi:hypothetical protein
VIVTRAPWITVALAVAIALLPLTHDIFYSAFLSNERLMQDFWRGVFLAGVVALIVLALAEWAVRRALGRRRGNTSSS